MPFPPLSDADVRAIAGTTMYQRGVSYFRNHAVSDLVQRGEMIVARVQGSDIEPYRIMFHADEREIRSFSCSCPYEHGVICKHLVAVLLTIINTPDALEVRPSLSAMLEPLQPDQLHSLLLAIGEEFPDVADFVERRTTFAGHGSLASTTLVPPDELRRIMKRLLREAEREESYYSEEVSFDEEQWQSLLDTISATLQAQNGNHALAQLEAITSPLMDHLRGDYWDFSPFSPEYFDFEELDHLWATALLMFDVDNEQRNTWQTTLTRWAKMFTKRNYQDPFEQAIHASHSDWDDPALQAILAGADEEKRFDSLALVRLQVLAYTGKTAEYLRLAQATESHQEYAAMLIAQQQIDQAVNYTLQHIQKPEPLYALVQLLEQRGQRAAALRVASHGVEHMPAQTAPHAPFPPPLTQQHAPIMLASLVRDWAFMAGQHETSLNAALTALSLQTTLENYTAIASIAGDQWATYRDQALAIVNHADDYWHGQQKIWIYLHEGMSAQAIAVADKHPMRYEMLEQVSDKVINQHPEWVLKHAKKNFAEIANAGKSAYYDVAIRWLTRARDAYVVMNRAAEWQAWINELVETHKRKRSLLPGLQALQRS